MVRLTRIYTRGGDAGETSLGDGARVAKHDPRVEAFGTVDEANAAIGLARLSAPPEADAMLARIQNDLFDLGADLCTPEDGRRAAGALRMGLSHGLYCLGCCWILMALLFVGGVMNLLWVAVLAAVVLIEKLFPLGFWMARISGVLLAAYGIGLLAVS